MEREKQVYNGNRISLYDYKDEKGNDAIILEYGTTKLYIWDEDFEEFIHGVNFMLNKNKPRGDFYR
tara:strand:+ start:204 stop:401 length:198 start_codon:yes stop_codon:yes gene_type:complete